MKTKSDQSPENTGGQTTSGKSNVPRGTSEKPKKEAEQYCDSIVEVPKAKPDKPKLTAKELDDAAKELGLSRLGDKTVKALRDVGIATEQHGAIKVALGRVIVSDDKLDRLMEVTLDVAQTSEDDEIKLKAAEEGTGLANQISKNADLIYKMASQKLILQSGEERKFQSFGPDHVVIPIQNKVEVNLTEPEQV